MAKLEDMGSVLIIGELILFARLVMEETIHIAKEMKTIWMWTQE
jgi:hypothetical protein